MPVPTAITDLSQTAASNFPSGSDSPANLDDVQRAHGSFIAQLRDGKAFTNPVTLASASTTDIGAQNAFAVEISGTTTITSFGTTYYGPRFLRFTGALTLTHSATLNLPAATNITTAAGDTCIAYPNSALSGWNVLAYQKASGAAIAGTTDYLNTTRTDVASSATVDLTSLAGATRHINITGTTTITGFTVTAGQTYFVRFNAALTLTNNAAIITQTGANITTAAGDTCILRSTASNTVEAISFVPANWNQAASTSAIGRVQLATAAQTQAASSTTLAVPPVALAKLLPKFWCNFDGTAASPITPRASFNVTNVTKTGTGVYEINLTSALADKNFAVSALGGDLTGGYGCMVDYASSTTSKIVVNTYNGWGAAGSPSTLMVSGFGT